MYAASRSHRGTFVVAVYSPREMLSRRLVISFSTAPWATPSIILQHLFELHSNEFLAVFAYAGIDTVATVTAIATMGAPIAIRPLVLPHRPSHRNPPISSFKSVQGFSVASRGILN
jgi:hypothetical protein